MTEEHDGDGAPPENFNTVTGDDQDQSLPYLDMKEQDAEDDAPPPGWDSKQALEPAAVSSDMKTEDVRQDVQTEEGPKLGPEAHPSSVSERLCNYSRNLDSFFGCYDMQELICDNTDIKVDHQDSEDEGPPPGWDSKCQPEPKLQVELPSTPPSGHMQADDVPKDAQNEADLPQQSPAHTSQLSELVASDMQVEKHESEDAGPPPGWDSKCQPEPESQSARPTTPQSDTKMIDVHQDAQNEEGPEPRSQAHPSPPSEVVPSNIKMDQQDLEDGGPPPGLDSKCQPGSNPTTLRSDTKTEDIQQIQNEDGHQPQSLADSAAAPEPVPSDTKMMVVQQDAQNEEGPQPRSQAHPSPPPELVPSDIKTEAIQQIHNEDGHQQQSLADPAAAPEPVPSDTVAEQQDLEDDGPPPGWDSKCESEPKVQEACPSNPQSDTNLEEQYSEDDGPPPGWASKCQPEQKLQMTCSSDSKMEDDQRETHDYEGPPPGWEPTPQQESQAHLSASSHGVQSGGRMDCEQKNVNAVKEDSRPPSRKQSITPTEPQVAMSKRPRSIERSITPTEPQIPMPKRQRSPDNPEMGQMVCGSCRLLLSYPRGARYVECACCLEENYVLEEHEVGQVACGSCDVLLMYPYGAPKVRCVNCMFETEIGDQNRRPPLSEHKKRARQHLRRVQAS